MSSVNKVILIGNLGKDPEMRYLPSGEAIANFSVATSESWTDKTSGDKKEQTEWHRVVFFGRTAEVVGQYVKKGSKIYVEGRLQTRKWQDKEGQDRYTTEVVLQGFNAVLQLLDPPSGDRGQRQDDGGGGGRSAGSSGGGAGGAPRNNDYGSGAPMGDGFEDSEIPF